MKGTSVLTEQQINTLYQIIEYNANSIGNKTAIVDGKIKITYRQLNEQITQIADSLHNYGINHNDKVALIMSNSWQFIVNLLAINKIGAVIVPINNFLKEDELSYILNDAQVKLAFISNQFALNAKNLLAKTAVEYIIWVDGAPLLNNKNIAYAELAQNSHVTSQSVKTAKTMQTTQTIDAINQVAIIIYTSGTTGKPKGAMLTHKNLLSNCSACASHLSIGRNSFDMLCYLPMFHSFTLTTTIILPLYTGSKTIVIRSIATIKDFKYLLKQVLFSRCRFFTGIPDIYSAMARAKLPWYFHWFHNIIGFVCGGAPLSQEVYQRFSRSFKRGHLLQGYGISECSPVVACNQVKFNKPESVGRVIGDYQIKICDENMQTLTNGSIGEICVKGDCVMLGYYNRAEATAETIIDGWFKTGDLGYLDDDGYIFIVDRLKDLIIHKGMNIYPREIEEIMYTHEAINACAVIGSKDHDGNEIPLIYLELKDAFKNKLKENEVKDFLRPHLARFKLPRRVFFIDQLPRNATGKILKRKLRELDELRQLKP